MEKAGKAVPDPEYEPPNIWHIQVNEILTALAMVFSGKEKVKPNDVKYVEKCCAITETMESNSMLAPMIGHDLFQMAYLYQDTEPKDWIPIIETRKDDSRWGKGTCESFSVFMYGDSTFRFSKPDGKRDPNGKQKVASQMKKDDHRRTGGSQGVQSIWYWDSGSDSRTAKT